MSNGGKGSKARPMEVPRDTFVDNWQRTFGNKLTKCMVDFSGVCVHYKCERKDDFCALPIDNLDQ